jgi:hypothetical protein
MSLVARLLNVFAIPGDVFGEVKSSVLSHANWVVPAVLLTILGWISVTLIFSQPAIQQQLQEMTSQAIEKQIEKIHPSKEQADQMRTIGEKYAGISQKIMGGITPAVVGFATPFFWGVILWLVGTKVLKGQFSFMKAVEVAGLANAIAVLDSIIRTLLILGLGNLFASPSAALLVKDFDPQKPSHSLLAVANVMTFWLLAVRSIGLARLSGAPFLRSAAWVFGIWALYTSLLMGIGLAAKAAFGG